MVVIYHTFKYPAPVSLVMGKDSKWAFKGVPKLKKAKKKKSKAFSKKAKNKWSY